MNFSRSLYLVSQIHEAEVHGLRTRIAQLEADGRDSTQTNSNRSWCASECRDMSPAPCCKEFLIESTADRGMAGLEFADFAIFGDGDEGDACVMPTTLQLRQQAQPLAGRDTKCALRGLVEPSPQTIIEVNVGKELEAKAPSDELARFVEEFKRHPQLTIPGIRPGPASNQASVVESAGVGVWSPSRLNKRRPTTPRNEPTSPRSEGKLIRTDTGISDHTVVTAVSHATYPELMTRHQHPITPPVEVEERAYEKALSCASHHKRGRASVLEFLNPTLATSQSSETKALERVGIKVARTSRCVVNPERSQALEKWDIITMCSLVFVAIVTPVQIAMTDCVLECPMLFAINAVVDCVFFLDLILQFFLMYPKKTSFGHALEYRHKYIVLQYLKTWFAIDFLSILPFDLLSALSSSEEMAKMKAVKVIRLIRLLKLVRVLKASRLFRRFEVRMSFTYQRLALIKFFMVLAALTHWMACLWALTLMLVDSDVPRWVDTFDEEEANVVHKTKDTLWKKYIACLYFTSYTITSVGYGDIGPVNIVERIVCTLMILLSGVSWAMVLGQVCGIVGNMDADEQSFRKIMDELNCMMDDRQLPKAMRRRLRSFLISNKLAQRHKHQRQIVEVMSPGLQCEVTMELNRIWLTKVSFLNELLQASVDAHGSVTEAQRKLGDHFRMFVSEIAHEMQHLMYSQGEHFGAAHVLYILNQGLVSRRGRIEHAGAVWGTDFLISDPSLLHSPRCLSLTYVTVMILMRSDVLRILETYAAECPEIQRRVRRYVCWLAVQRGLMVEAKRRIELKEVSETTP